MIQFNETTYQWMSFNSPADIALHGLLESETTLNIFHTHAPNSIKLAHENAH